MVILVCFISQAIFDLTSGKRGVQWLSYAALQALFSILAASFELLVQWNAGINRSADAHRLAFDRGAAPSIPVSVLDKPINAWSAMACSI